MVTMKIQFDIADEFSHDENEVKKAYMRTYGEAVDVMNDFGIEEINNLFDKFYPEESGSDETYIPLFYDCFSEIGNKLSEFYGKLPDNRTVYIDKVEYYTDHSRPVDGKFTGHVE